MQVNGVGKFAPVVVSFTSEGVVKSRSVDLNSASEPVRKCIVDTVVTGDFESISIDPKNYKHHVEATGDGRELECVVKPNGTLGR